MKRQIVAIIEVDEDAAFEKLGDGHVSYLEKKLGWLEHNDTIKPQQGVKQK